MGVQGTALASALLLMVRSLSSQHSPSTADDSLHVGMHVKSGLLQLQKVITGSKGYIKDCCFHQYPRHTRSMARHILQQRTIMMRNASGVCSQTVSQTDCSGMPPGVGAAVLHLLGCVCTLPKLPVHSPIPYPLLSSLPFLPLM